MWTPTSRCVATVPPDVTVVVPTYQEIENLAAVVGLLRNSEIRVLVVDDSSPDGTGDLADRIAGEDAMVVVLHRPGKTGLGPAYVAGFEAALALGSDIVCQIDADLSHDPADLTRLIGAVVGGADVALGSRYVAGGDTVGWPWRRRILSQTGNRYVRLMLGLPVRDATSGFRAYRAEALATLEPGSAQASGYAFQIEMSWRAHQRGLRIVELPITFTERSLGSSKMSLGIAAEAVWLVTRWGLAWRWATVRRALSSLRR